MTHKEYEAFKKELAEKVREGKTDREWIEWLARYELSILAIEDVVLNGTGKDGRFTGLLGD